MNSPRTPEKKKDVTGGGRGGVAKTVNEASFCYRQGHRERNPKQPPGPKNDADSGKTTWGGVVEKKN